MGPPARHSTSVLLLRERRDFDAGFQHQPDALPRQNLRTFAR